MVYYYVKRTAPDVRYTNSLEMNTTVMTENVKRIFICLRNSIYELYGTQIIIPNHLM